MWGEFMYTVIMSHYDSLLPALLHKIRVQMYGEIMITKLINITNMNNYEWDTATEAS